MLDSAISTPDPPRNLHRAQRTPNLYNTIRGSFPGLSLRHIPRKKIDRPIGPSNGHGSERGRELAAAVFFLLLRAGGTPQHGSGRGRDQEIRRREAAALAIGCSF